MRTPRAAAAAALGLALALLLVAAVPILARAQGVTPWPCEPRSWAAPAASASERVEVWSLKGHATGWWCVVPPPASAASGATYWRPFLWAGLYSFAPGDWRAAAARITAASSPMAQARSEAAAAAASAPAGSVEACEHEQLLRQACAALHTEPYAGVPFGPAKFGPAEVASRCGDVRACAAAPPPSGAWVTSGITAYRAAGGALAGTAGRVTRGIACDCSRPLVIAGATYCPPAGAAAGVVAQCRRQ